MIEDLKMLVLGDHARSPRVIFLHDRPGIYGHKQIVCRSFAGHCNAVYYELRRSQQGKDGIGITDHIQDLERIVDPYSSKSEPIILGHSWGAMLAILFAGSHAERIAKTIEIGCGPLNKMQGDEFQNELILRFGNRKDYYDSPWDGIDEEKDEKRQ